MNSGVGRDYRVGACRRGPIVRTRDSFLRHDVRPSRENAGSLSLVAVALNTIGVPAFHPRVASPSTGKIITSRAVLGWISVYAIGQREIGHARPGID